MTNRPQNELYDIDPKVANILGVILETPTHNRRELMEEFLPDADLMDILVNFMGLVQSTSSNAKMIFDTILEAEGIKHPDRYANNFNMPTPFGALLGVSLAASAGPGKTCSGCAFRLAAPANQCAITVIDAKNERDVFHCHMGIEDGQEPTRKCGGA